MKKLLLIVSLIFIGRMSFAQNNMYMITEKIAMNPPGIDSLFVTSPTGTTIGYSLPNYAVNPAGHDSQFNLILNNIINTGYQLADMGNWYSTTSITPSLYNYLIRTIFLKEPWTLASQELDSANSTQLNINKIFPNPTDGISTLECSYTNGFEPVELIVYDLNGFIVLKHLINKSTLNSFDVDFSKLSNGEYFVTLKNNKVYCKPVNIIVKK